jgi:hypothetical protein
VWRRLGSYRHGPSDGRRCAGVDPMTVEAAQRRVELRGGVGTRRGSDSGQGGIQ